MHVYIDHNLNIDMHTQIMTFFLTEYYCVEILFIQTITL